MSLNLPKFDVSGMSELQSQPRNSSCAWGWIGSVSLENKQSLREFLIAAENGDVASMKLFQDLASNVAFALARIYDDEAVVVVLEKTEELVAPKVIGVWAVENAGIVIGPSVPEGIESHLTKVTRLSWKEICAAIVRSFK